VRLVIQDYPDTEPKFSLWLRPVEDGTVSVVGELINGGGTSAELITFKVEPEGLVFYRDTFANREPGVASVDALGRIQEVPK
jgi:hypothetical protein